MGKRCLFYNNTGGVILRREKVFFIDHKRYFRCNIILQKCIKGKNEETWGIRFFFLKKKR